jgi:hypothetical protein
MNRLRNERARLKGTRTFIKKGTCSRTYFYILDREFGHPMEEEEKAMDPMAGGILQQGYQCGFIWGAAMAVGAEALRRTQDPGQAKGLAIIATQHLLSSFLKRTGSFECEEITSYDLSNKKSFAKYMLSGKFVACFKLAGKWAPEALEAAKEGLSEKESGLPPETLSCASELIRKCGGSEKEITMVAGFAGGLGLSGSGCGALAAALWKNALVTNRKEDEKEASFDPHTNPVLQVFYEETDYEIECRNICGKNFESLEDHSKFVRNGGCRKLIHLLAKQISPPENQMGV